VRTAAGGRASRPGGQPHRIVPAALEQSFKMMAAGRVADGEKTDVTWWGGGGGAGAWRLRS